MSMTKAEKARLDQAKAEVLIARALRWNGLKEPERLPIPERGYTNGWSINTYGAGTVDAAWTERVANGRGHRFDDNNANGISASKDGRRLFATKRDALIALRVAKEREYALLLATIDTLIERESAL